MKNSVKDTILLYVVGFGLSEIISIVHASYYEILWGAEIAKAGIVLIIYAFICGLIWHRGIREKAELACKMMVLFGLASVASLVSYVYICFKYRIFMWYIPILIYIFVILFLFRFLSNRVNLKKVKKIIMCMQL